MEKVTVYAEKYAMCTPLGNTRSMPRWHIGIKLTYGNGENDSLCGKICNMHTFGKYANNAAIAYLHKTGIYLTGIMMYAGV